MKDFLIGDSMNGVQQHLDYVVFLESIGSETPEVRRALIEGYSGYVLNESVGKTVKGLLLAAACMLTACAGNAPSVQANFDNMQPYMRGIDGNGVNAETVRQLATRVSDEMHAEAEKADSFRDTKAWKEAIAIKKALQDSHPDDGSSGEGLASMFERSVNQQNKVFGAPPCCTDEDDESIHRRNMAANIEPSQGHFDEETNTWVY